MSIAIQIQRLQQAKADIKTALIAKGVTVEENVTLDNFGTLIESIDSGIIEGVIPEKTNISSNEFRNSNFMVVDMPNTVQYIQNNAFSYCYNLINITLSNNLKVINSGVFSHCTNLRSIIIPNSVTVIAGESFRNCENLRNVILSNNITVISSSCFTNCFNLKTISIPDSIITIEGGAFMNCGLTNIIIPKNVTNIGLNAFSDCINLINIKINAIQPPTLAGVVFENTNNCPIYVPAESVETYKTAYRWSKYANRIQAIPTEE